MCRFPGRRSTFVNLHVQISWEAQHFVNLHVQIALRQRLGCRVLRRQSDGVLLRLVVAVHTYLRNTSYIRRARYSPTPLSHPSVV